MAFNNLLGSVQCRLAGSSRVAHLAVSLRNQCNCVINYHLGPTSDAAGNGELWLAEAMGPDSKTFVDVGANVGDWAQMFLGAMKTEGRGCLSLRGLRWRN
jgi:hypothetical protein